MSNPPREPPPDWHGIKPGPGPDEKWIFLFGFVCFVILVAWFVIGMEAQT